jgi:hypothetical protein
VSLSRKLSPVFIGGQMKSGTTLLRSLLSQHPNIFGGLETHWFDLGPNPTKDLDEIKKLCFFYDINNNELDNILEAKSLYGISFIHAFLNFATRRAKKARWVEKTPANVSQLDRIFTEFEDAYFLHVVRDYRDIYSSWKLANKGDVNQFIDHVKISYTKIMDYRNHERYREIHYQDLVFNVDETLTSILMFINEQPSISCLEINAVNSESEFNKVKAFTGKESSTLISTQQKISTKKVGFYKNILSANEQKQIETELEYFFSLFGASNAITNC